MRGVERVGSPFYLFILFFRLSARSSTFQIKPNGSVTIEVGSRTRFQLTPGPGETRWIVSCPFTYRVF